MTFHKIKLFKIIPYTYIINNRFDNRDELMNAIVCGERPASPKYISQEWKNLISNCWHQEPNKRPSFDEILNELETSKFLWNNSTEYFLKIYKSDIKQ